MSTCAGKTNFVLNASAPEFQPANLDPRRLLNASAPEFQPANPERRCLFLTFSNGFPLMEGHIFTYFSRMYGPVVENVYVHRPRPKGSVAKPPLFGKVMFRHSIILDYVMDIKEKVCLIVDGIPVYCKRFVSPRP